MILVAIIALSTVVLGLIFSVLQALPVIPNTFMTIYNYVLPHVLRGVKFVNNFIYPQIVWPLAIVCIGMHAVYVTYRVYMWIVKKIPLFGVSD